MRIDEQEFFIKIAGAVGRMESGESEWGYTPEKEEPKEELEPPKYLGKPIVVPESTENKPEPVKEVTPTASEEEDDFETMDQMLQDVARFILDYNFDEPVTEKSLEATIWAVNRFFKMVNLFNKDKTQRYLESRKVLLARVYEIMDHLRNWVKSEENNG